MFLIVLICVCCFLRLRRRPLVCFVILVRRIVGLESRLVEEVPRLREGGQHQRVQSLLQHRGMCVREANPDVALLGEQRRSASPVAWGKVVGLLDTEALLRRVNSSGDLKMWS